MERTDPGRETLLEISEAAEGQAWDGHNGWQDGWETAA